MNYSLQTYVKDVGNGMNSNMLEQNRRETEFIVFSSELHKKKAQNLNTEIGSSYIKSFGFISDGTFAIKKQENSICCYYQITFSVLSVSI